MSEDIFEFKPNFYGVGIDLKALWKKIRRQPHRPIDVVAIRFVEVFEKHGVAVTQIPRLLPTIDLSQLASSSQLLSSLTDKVLETTSDLFGVRREWLEGTSSQIYPLRSCYKQPHRFFEELRALASPATLLPVRAFTTDNNLDYRKSSNQRLELVLLERVDWLGDEEIVRYRPFSDGWEWCYERTRLELKAIVANYGHPVPLFQISQKDMDALYSGEVFPRALLKGSLSTFPSLEDYCMPLNRNVRARETEELESVAVYQKAIALQHW